MLNLKKYWLFQIGGWGSVALINIFFAFSFDRLETVHERQLILVRLFFFIIIGLMSSHLMRFVFNFLQVTQKELRTQLLFFLFITIIISIAASTFNIVLLREFDFLSKGEKTFKENIPLLILSRSFYFFLYFLIWGLIYFSYHFVSKTQKQQLDNLKFEALVKELELKTIRAHINPHFIFNSMNSIRALIDENPKRARNAITELSNILRSSMQTEKMETVTLDKELSIIKDYLALEIMRFEDRLHVIYEVTQETQNRLVPPMMLQMLVENAIKHGISKQIKGGEVKIISKIENGYHQLIVQNTGKFNGTLNTETNINFGLSSTINRLRLLYGDKAQFGIKQLSEETVEAKILLPL